MFVAYVVFVLIEYFNLNSFIMHKKINGNVDHLKIIQCEENFEKINAST